MYELWRDILGTDGSYQVSSLGRVRSCIAPGSHKRTDVWRIRRLSGTVGGYLHCTYYIRDVDGCSRRVTRNVHRIMWMAFGLDIPLGYELDHIDHDRQHNVLDNLRLVTVQQNQANQRIRTMYNGKPKTSKYRGVTWDTQRERWCAQIQVSGRSYNLGRYKDEQEAAVVYNEAALRYFKEYANINIV